MPPMRACRQSYTVEAPARSTLPSHGPTGPSAIVDGGDDRGGDDRLTPGSLTSRRQVSFVRQRSTIVASSLDPTLEVVELVQQLAEDGRAKVRQVATGDDGRCLCRKAPGILRQHDPIFGKQTARMVDRGRPLADQAVAGTMKRLQGPAGPSTSPARSASLDASPPRRSPPRRPHVLRALTKGFTNED